MDITANVPMMETKKMCIRDRFPNPDRELLSGSIGNVILQNPKTEAVTIPMTATVELQDKIIAYRLKDVYKRQTVQDGRKCNLLVHDECFKLSRKNNGNKK